MSGRIFVGSGDDNDIGGWALFCPKSGVNPGLQIAILSNTWRKPTEEGKMKHCQEIEK